jgi:hypothetical protein
MNSLVRRLELLEKSRKQDVVGLEAVVPLSERALVRIPG